MAPFIGRVSVALDVSVDEHFRLANEETYIFGSDMGSNEEWFEQGTKLIAVNDSRITIYNPEGLDIPVLLKLKDEGACDADKRQAKPLMKR